MKFSNNLTKNALIARLQESARQFDSVWKQLTAVGGRFLVIHGRCTKTPFSNVYGNSPVYWAEQMERAAAEGNLENCAKVVQYRKSELLSVAMHSLAIRTLRQVALSKAEILRSVIAECLNHIGQATPCELTTDLLQAVELLNGDWSTWSDEIYQITNVELQTEATFAMKSAFDSLHSLLRGQRRPTLRYEDFNNPESAIKQLYTIARPVFFTDQTRQRHVPMGDIIENVNQNHFPASRSLPAMTSRLEQLVDQAMKVTREFQEGERGYVNEAEFKRFSQVALRGEVGAKEYADRLRSQRRLRVNFESACQRVRVAISLAMEQCASLIGYLTDATNEIQCNSYSGQGKMDHTTRQMAMAVCLATDVTIRESLSDLSGLTAVLENDITAGEGKKAMQLQLTEIRKQFGSQS